MRGEQLLSIVKNGELVKFNSRPCGRGDSLSSSMKPRGIYFNSRPCGRGDLWRQSLSIRALIFQFTPLREGRPGTVWARALQRDYFNSRPCGRGDEQLVRLLMPYIISIHAPAGGATYPQYTTVNEKNEFQFTPLREGRLGITIKPDWGKIISIHAPAGGATRSSRSRQHRSQFQFTPLREGRPIATPPRTRRKNNYNTRPSGRAYW